MKLTRRDFSVMAAVTALSHSPSALAQKPEHTQKPIFINLDQVKWELDNPKLGPDSPGIAVLHLDPLTQSTQLLIRNGPGEYIPRHWHSANETNTILSGHYTFECDGKKVEQGPGSFNYIPARMVHRAWLRDGEPGLDFITVDGKWDINWVADPDRPRK